MYTATCTKRSAIAAHSSSRASAERENDERENDEVQSSGASGLRMLRPSMEGRQLEARICVDKKRENRSSKPVRRLLPECFYPPTGAHF